MVEVFAFNAVRVKEGRTASSNETPCLVLLLAAFSVSHSNTNYVYTKMSCVQVGPRAESLGLEASCDAERMRTVRRQREE